MFRIPALMFALGLASMLIAGGLAFTPDASAQRPLADQCSRNSDCADGLICEIVGSGRRCRLECLTTRDCADGLLCVKHTPADDYAQCVPSDAIGESWFPALEEGTDRPGNDIKAVTLDRADPLACHTECLAERGCRAWTYVEPGMQGALARCYLKNPVPEPRANRRTVSGVIPGPPPVRVRQPDAVVRRR